MFKRILVPVDLAHEWSWRDALPAAARQAQDHGAELIAMTVVPEIDPDDLKRRPQDSVGDLKKLLGEHVPEGLNADAVVKTGSVHRQIRRTAEERGVDLIVMASHHPEWTDYVIGSNAAQVVLHADCSVLVLRGR
jgi:nucleotide-binding universal stress UspA family protein